MGIAIPMPAGQVYDTAEPTTGQTVVMTDDNRDGMLFMNPAGPLAAVTVQLPSEAKSRLGQIRRIASSKAVTILTVSGATTIYNAPAALAVGDGFTLLKIAANTWTTI